MDFTQTIRGYLDREAALIQQLDTESINRALCEIVAAYEREGTIYIFGNGGSASTASHYANDFDKGISEYCEKKFRFVCLNDNVPMVMAVANDLGYEEVFRFQLQGRLRPGDLVIGISGSGTSANVVNALTYAHDRGVRTMGITGFDGGMVKTIVDVPLHVPVMNMQVTEDIHMIFVHLMVSTLYSAWHIGPPCVLGS